MKTENLAKTNVIDELKASHIEFFLNKELDTVYNYMPGYTRNGLEVHPGTVIYQNNFPFRGHFFTHLHSVSWDQKNMVLTVTGRNRHKRHAETKLIQYKIVGYKLPTTKLDEGWIYGTGSIN